ETIGMPKNPTFQRIYRLFFFLNRKKIKQTVEKLKGFDKIIAYQYPMTVIAAKAKKSYGTKYVYHDAGIAYPRLFGRFSERLYLRLFSFFTSRSIKTADEFIFISDFLRKEMMQKTGKDGEIEYVDIDHKRFNLDAKGDDIKKQFSLTYPTLLYVGRISPHKNVHTLIDAFNIVTDHFPDAKLLIVGKPTFTSYLKKLKKGANESIIFTGFVPDEALPGYYAASDLYVTASLWEGFDIPAVEAQACGKKVVAYDIGSHKEVVKEGHLVEELTDKALASGIIDILKK
ncbi:MAG: glycosyltransferase, partial [Candidatus Woesearchaeota archaeon]|nr:glycosyltransferase [Candidatus Woesearchaeota archaeon]